MEINLTASRRNALTAIESIGGFSEAEASALLDYLSEMGETVNLDLVDSFSSYESISEAYEDELGYKIKDSEICNIEDMDEDEIEEAKDEIRKEKLGEEGTLIEVSGGKYLYSGN